MITGVGVTGEPSHPSFRDTFLGSKEDLDWLKIDLNAAKIITAQNYRVFIPKSEEFSNKFEVFFSNVNCNSLQHFDMSYMNTRLLNRL